jgi:hypothetical protein
VAGLNKQRLGEGLWCAHNNVGVRTPSPDESGNNGVKTMRRNKQPTGALIPSNPI